MDAADATLRPDVVDTAEPPSLLTIILDTNPHAWAAISSSLPFARAIANLLVFVNAHLAINAANRVGILASHIDRVEWLYPSTTDNDNDDDNESEHPTDNANKYRPFARVEHAISMNLRRLMNSTSASALEGAITSQIGGALTRALTFINKQVSAEGNTNAGHATFNYSDPSAMAGSNDASMQEKTNSQRTLSPRILIITLSPDAPDQYIPIMNSIFASQRLSIPLDILPLTPSNKTFLQQAADATQGIYLPVTTPTAHAGLLQYLMFAYLPDVSARQHLISPGNDSNVDFRAACFCHRRIIDLGFVCSVCLSIFCKPVLDENGQCLTCSSSLSLGDFGRKPAVVPKRKKKKKRNDLEGSTTPMSGVEA